MPSFIWVSGQSASRTQPNPCASSIWFADKNKCRPGHDRRARANEPHVDVLHLSRPGPSRRLQRALDDMPKPVDPACAQTAAERVERQFAVQFDPAVLNEIQRLAFLAE